MLSEHYGQQLRIEREARENTRFEFSGLLQTDASNYLASVGPAQALLAYDFSSRALRITQLIRELKHDRVQGIADEAVVFLESGKTRIPHAVIPSWIWYRMQIDADHDFWETGYFQMLIPANEANTRIQGSIEFFSVRFWPEGLPGGVDRPIPANVETGTDHLPSVSRAELGKWHKLFHQLYPDSPEVMALRSAKAMFPDNHVPRQWVRDLRGSQKHGKPTSRHE